MTPERHCEMCSVDDPPSQCRGVDAGLTPEESEARVRIAVGHEREACARICDAVAAQHEERGPQEFLRRELGAIVKKLARELAATIRARPRP